MKIKDLVTRYSHSHDVVFQIIGENKGVYQLKGVDYRLYADASKDDLKPYDQRVALQLPKLNIPHNVASGKVLHIDGDATYVIKAKEVYEKYHIPAACYHIVERDIPSATKVDFWHFCSYSRHLNIIIQIAPLQSQNTR